MNRNFALIGAAGYIAPRHLRAVRDTGNQLLVATDPHDSVGVLDQYFLDAKYFPEIERFDRHIEKLRRGPEENRIHYVSICSPNYLHDAHVRLALRVDADAICEKPLVINPWNLDALKLMETETSHRVYTVLQLRVHPSLVALKDKLEKEERTGKNRVELTYITGRGGWYHVSWKGVAERSGGLTTNIGIHFFDLLIWLFGDVVRCDVHLSEPKRTSGFLELKRAYVRWFLSVDTADLPFPVKPGGMTTYRSIALNGKEIEFTEGFADLHTRIYENILAGKGLGIEEARPSIELAHKIRTARPLEKPENLHPFVEQRRP